LDGAPNAALGVIRFLDMAEGQVADEPCPGCPIAPTALESPIVSPRLRATAARCFDKWAGLIAARLRADGWPKDSVAETASAVLALIEGALLLARVSGRVSHLANAKRAAVSLLAVPAVGED
jgi:TetR/AcrR family transcriptional repressor of lmrAB and yxaGH operons